MVSNAVTAYERTKVLAKERGYSIKEICSKVGINESIMYHWRSKGTVPKIEVLLEIANVLDTTVEYLFNGFENEDSEFGKVNQETLKLVTMIKKLSRQDKRIVARIVDSLYRNDLS